MRMYLRFVQCLLDTNDDEIVLQQIGFISLFLRCQRLRAKDRWMNGQTPRREWNSRDLWPGEVVFLGVVEEEVFLGVQHPDRSLLGFVASVGVSCYAQGLVAGSEASSLASGGGRLASQVVILG